MTRTPFYRVRAFSIRVANPVLRHVAHRLPSFALVTYRGRKTGRTYRIPLNVFRDGSDWAIVLTYGSDAAWVKNVLAAGGADIVTRGREVRLVDPRIVRDHPMRFLPRPVRSLLRRAGVHEVMLLGEAARD